MLASRLSRIARIARIARHVAARSPSRRCAPPARRDLFLTRPPAPFACSCTRVSPVAGFRTRGVLSGSNRLYWGHTIPEEYGGGAAHRDRIATCSARQTGIGVALSPDRISQTHPRHIGVQVWCGSSGVCVTTEPEDTTQARRAGKHAPRATCQVRSWTSETARATKRASSRERVLHAELVRRGAVLHGPVQRHNY